MTSKVMYLFCFAVFLMLGSWLPRAYTLAQSAPQVLSVTPSPGATDVPLHQPSLLRIEFDQPMNKESVENAIELSPGNVAFRWRFYRSFIWEDDSTVSVIRSSDRFDGVAESLNSGTEYTVTLETTAESSTGMSLVEPFEWSFTSKARIVNNTEAASFFTTAFQEQFGVEIPHPAYVEEFNANIDLRYWTGTAYIYSKLYRIYLLEDGTALARTTAHKKPVGTYRVAVVAVDHGNTNIADLLDNLWVEAQAEINDLHQSFADAFGYGSPILQFENTNFLASSSQINNPRSPSDIVAFVEGNGFNQDDFDLFVSLDMDAQNRSGGFAIFGGSFIYMSNLSLASDLTARRLYSLARAIYSHEAGHVFGWEHWWSSSGENSNPSFPNF